MFRTKAVENNQNTDIKTFYGH